MRHALRLFSTIVLLGLSAAAIFVAYNWQDFQDYYKVYSYQPAQNIIGLADRSGMSDKGRFYFYATSPELETASQFNGECRRAEQGSPILGCYKSASDTIHIYDITNPELDGIKEVTAAHEMLHAAFARFSSREIAEIAPLLEQAYERVKTDKLVERMGYYERTAPGTHVNELHSIIGTEFFDIGEELEQHYAKYFSNRRAVVELNQSYSQKFDNIERQINDLTASLEQQAVMIESLTASYDQDTAAINLRISQFNSRAESGYYSSQAQFNQDRLQLNRQVEQLNIRRNNILSMVDRYNSDVAKLNDLGGKMDELNQGVDSLRGVEQGVEAI